MLREIATFLVGHLVFAALLAVGLQTRLSDLTEVFRNRRLLWRSLLVIEIVIPLLAILLVGLMRPRPLPGGVVLLFSICPGVALLPFLVKSKGGRVSTALGLLLILTALAPVTVPIWMAILNELFPFRLHVQVGHLVAKLVPTVLLPLAIGLAIRRLLPGAGDLLARVVNWFIIAALVVAVIMLLKIGGHTVLEVTPLGLVGLSVLVLGSMLLGHWAGAPELEDRKAVAMAAILGNPALVLLIVKESYPELEVTALVMAYVLLRVLLMLPYQIWTKRKGKGIDTHARTTRFDPGQLPGRV